MFKDPKKRQIIIYLPPERWGSVHTGPGAGTAASREKKGTESIYKTLLNFEGVLALVKPVAPPAVVAPPPVVQPVVAPQEPPKPVAPPMIVLSSPSAAGPNQAVEWNESPLVIRGVAMDSTGIPVVTIQGSPANMRPKSEQAAEFWSDALPLQPGNNRIQITASNAAHAEANLVVLVHFTPKPAPMNPRALDKKEIIALLQGGVPAARITDLVKERGIKFSPSGDDLNEIRAAGGSDEIIEAVQQAAAHGSHP